MPLQPHLDPQLLLQPFGGQMLYDVERLAFTTGGGELDRPDIPRNLQSRLVRRRDGQHGAEAQPRYTPVRQLPEGPNLLQR